MSAGLLVRVGESDEIRLAEQPSDERHPCGEIRTCIARGHRDRGEAGLG